MKPPHNPRLAATAELGAFFGLFFVVIWLGQDIPFRPPLLIIALLLLGICRLSNRWHGDDRRKIGLASDQFKPCVRLTLKITIVPLAILVAWALSRPAPPLPQLLFGLLGYPLKFRHIGRLLAPGILWRISG